MDSKYEEVVNYAFKQEERVCSYEINGVRVYLKKREKQKKLIHILQSILQKITRDPMLMISVLSNSENEILYESSKIKMLEKLGVNVPHILEVTDNYFIMSDTGESLKNYIYEQIKSKNIVDKEKQENFKNKYVLKALDILIKLHNTNNAQGGCQIRNFTIKDDRISLIDFEEKIPKDYIKTFQKRDFLLLILSLQKAGFNPDIEYLSNYYSNKTEYKNLYVELKDYLLKYKWLLFLDSGLFKKIRMKDVRDLLYIIRQVEDKGEEKYV